MCLISNAPIHHKPRTPSIVICHMLLSNNMLLPNNDQVPQYYLLLEYPNLECHKHTEIGPFSTL